MNAKQRGPGRGGSYSVEHVILEGGPTWHMAMPGQPATGVQRCAPQPASCQSRVPLVPTEEEVAALPRLAREAFVARCALRVKPVRDSGVAAAADAARVLFETATIDTPLTAQLRCIRRDFVRLRRLAKKEKWTDETPVPPEVFGPMWPQGVEPYWAAEPPAPPATPQTAGG
jgi:hypothetical protein